MNREQIAAKFTEMLRELAENDDIVLTDETTADDVDEWDSLLHVNLIIAMEAEFSIRFETDEINAPENVGQVYDLIERKVAKG